MTTATNEPTTGAGRRLLAQWAGAPNAPAALVVQAIGAIEAEAAAAERSAIREAVEALRDLHAVTHGKPSSGHVSRGSVYRAIDARFRS